MPPILAILRKLCRNWWLTITLPRRERRSQAVWEVAQGIEPLPFEGVPSPMGHLSLEGLWGDPPWESVARVSAAHNRRVDAWLELHGGPIGATIVLRPDSVVRVVPHLELFDRGFGEIDYRPARFAWAGAIGGAGSALVAGLQMRHRQQLMRVEDERYRQKALQAAMRANQAKVRLSADYNGVPDYDPDYN